MTEGRSEWESLAPWVKASQWYEVAPHIADQVMELAQKRAKEQMALEREQAKHRIALERERAEHARRMDTRIWITQLVALFLCLVNIAAFSVVGWHYADTGNIVPGLTFAATSASLTIGMFAVARRSGRGSTYLSENQEQEESGSQQSDLPRPYPDAR